MEGKKHCTKCKEEKLYTEFHKNKTEPDGYSHRCKSCRKLETAARYEKDKDKILSKNAEYAAKHKPERNEYIRLWKKENRAKKKAIPVECQRCGKLFLRKKSWLCEDCRKIRAKENYIRYAAENKEKISSWNKAYNASPERKAYRKEYHKKYMVVRHVEISAARKKRYQLLKDDPAHQRMIAAARVTVRAKRGRTDANHIKHIYAWQEGCCYYCNRVVPKSEREIDHIVPVSLGGSAHPYNVVLACHECNSSAQKFNHLVSIEWFPENKNLGHSVLSTLDKQAPENVTVVSSFWGSARYLENPETVLDGLENQIVVFDDEWLHYEKAIRFLSDIKLGKKPPLNKDMDLALDNRMANLSKFYATPTGVFDGESGSIDAMRDADFFMDGLNESTLNIANGRYAIYGNKHLRILLKGLENENIGV